MRHIDIMRRQSHNDVENGSVYKFRDSMASPDYSSQFGDMTYEETTVVRQSIPRRIFESFKRDPKLHLTPNGAVGGNGRVWDAQTAAAGTASSPLARKLKSRHLQMIAIGGSIGILYFILFREITSNVF